MNKVDQILERVDLKSKTSIQEAASEMIGMNNVSEGDDVTVVDGSTFPYEGQVGKVTKIDKDTGLAHVKFPSAAEPVPFLCSLLVPVGK
jgi:transcription antitermination factor NusG